MSVSIAYWVKAHWVEAFPSMWLKKGIRVDSEASSFIFSFPSQNANVQSPYVASVAH